MPMRHAAWSRRDRAGRTAAGVVMSGLIGLDWGTSSLRAFRIDDARASATRERPWGIRCLPEGGFDAALADLVAGWPDDPLIACGMVGSRQGWTEAAYLETPARAEALAQHLARVTTADGRVLHIVPGLHHRRGPDVMRGEETQLVGALAGASGACTGSTFILPGTHSKWVAVRDAAVVDFATMMTGELFALLCKHSILGAGMDTGGEEAAAFERGVREARDSAGEGGFSRLFSTRSRLLEGDLSPAGSAEYLSGLLVGEEFRAMLSSRRFDTADAVHMIGAEALCARYRRAATLFDIEIAPPVGPAAAHGLWHIACLAGLVPGRPTPAPPEY